MATSWPHLLIYALSHLPPDTTIQQAGRWWKARWQVARGYEHLTGELDLDHCGGRSWPAVRRAFQRLLAPSCRFACTACAFYAASGAT